MGVATFIRTCFGQHVSIPRRSSRLGMKTLAFLGAVSGFCALPGMSLAETSANSLFSDVSSLCASGEVDLEQRISRIVAQSDWREATPEDLDRLINVEVLFYELTNLRGTYTEEDIEKWLPFHIKRLRSAYSDGRLRFAVQYSDDEATSYVLSVWDRSKELAEPQAVVLDCRAFVFGAGQSLVDQGRQSLDLFPMQSGPNFQIWRAAVTRLEGVTKIREGRYLLVPASQDQEEIPTAVFGAELNQWLLAGATQ
jgi:hypothetical protein